MRFERSQASADSPSWVEKWEEETQKRLTLDPVEPVVCYGECCIGREDDYYDL